MPRSRWPIATLIASLALLAPAGVGAAGTIQEFPAPTPWGIAAGTDGNLWFTEGNAHKLGRMTPAGVVTEYALPAAGPLGIAAGPDGNVWFTEADGNKIGKITATGTITEFAIPTASAYPLGLAAGPDGNLWFTEYSGFANKIARITPGGAITEYALPTNSVFPSGIAAGPDGNLWFTEEEGNKIGKITTTGVVTEYALPTSGASPAGIAAGSDGNLWFTENRGSKIGRITTAGTVTEYPLPAGADPWFIAAGPDGNLWFTEYRRNKIGTITPGGSITEYDLPTADAAPVGITAGPGGYIWFTENGADNIGRITVSAASQSSSVSTEIHNGAHAVVTTVPTGTTVHDFVTVTGQTGRPTPTGNANIDWFLDGACAGNPAADSGSSGPLDANGQFDGDQFAFTVDAAGQRAFRAHYEGDSLYAASDGPCERLTVVDANIQLTPPTATNPVNTTHTYTASVSVNDGSGGYVPAPNGTLVTFTLLPGSVGSFLGGNSTCQTSGGSCTVQTTSALAGSDEATASTTVAVGLVQLTRTSNAGLNSWTSPTADLRIQKSASPTPVPSGSQLTYTITVTNNGPLNATGVAMTDQLPAEIHFKSMSTTRGTCARTTVKSNDPKDGLITCNLGSLAAGSNATVTIVVLASRVVLLSNTACVTGNEPDPISSNNCATARTSVVGP